MSTLVYDIFQKRVIPLRMLEKLPKENFLLSLKQIPFDSCEFFSCAGNPF